MNTTKLREQAQRLPLISAALFAILAVLAVVLMKDTSYQLTLGHLTKDALASQNGPTVLAPASRILLEVPLRVLVSVVLGISALGMLLMGTRFKAANEKAVKKNVVPARWIYFAVTFALMTEVLALLSGINDLAILKLIAGVVVAAKLLDWHSEQMNKGAKKPTWFTFGLSALLNALPWLVILVSVIGTTVFGMERLAWYVYALYAAALGSLIALALNMRNQFRRTGKSKDYVFIDRNYLLIDLLSKAAFAVILIIGLRK